MEINTFACFRHPAPHGGNARQANRADDLVRGRTPTFRAINKRRGTPIEQIAPQITPVHVYAILAVPEVLCCASRRRLVQLAPSSLCESSAARSPACARAAEPYARY